MGTDGGSSTSALASVAATGSSVEDADTAINKSSSRPRELLLTSARPQGSSGQPVSCSHIAPEAQSHEWAISPASHSAGRPTNDHPTNKMAMTFRSIVTEI